MWKNLKEDVTHIECLNFSSVLGYHKIQSSHLPLMLLESVKEMKTFIHWLIKLMCGTHDDLDKSPQ